MKNEAEKKRKDELDKIPDTMPLYNPSSYCPKCSNPTYTQKHVICNFKSSYGYSGEAIQKECCSCRYNWWEHTADFKPKPKQLKHNRPEN